MKRILRRKTRKFVGSSVESVQKMTGVVGALPATLWLMSLRTSALQRVRQSPSLMGSANPIRHNCASRHDGTDRLAIIS